MRVEARWRPRRAPGARALVCAALILAPGLSCGSAWQGLFRRDNSEDYRPPPELAVERQGRWTCGAELPQGRPSSTFELLCHLGTGRAWRLVLDADGFAQLQLVEHRGRARQGCWAELAPEEVAVLDGITRSAALCERPDDSRASDRDGWFDVAVHLGETSCTRHLAAASLGKSERGRRFAQDIRSWLDRVSNGSFRGVEAFATEGHERPRDTGPFKRGRLICASDRETIYDAGDSWMLDYSFQKGLLWQRSLEISNQGEVALGFASFQNGAHTECIGRLTDQELLEVGRVLDESRPCNLPTTEARARQAHGYLSVHHNSTLCRYRPIRQDTLGDSFEGRRFDRLITTLVGNLVGEGGVNPFHPQVGLLFEPRPSRPQARPREQASTQRDDVASR